MQVSEEQGLPTPLSQAVSGSQTVRGYNSVVIRHPVHGVLSPRLLMHTWAGVVMVVVEPFPQSRSQPFDKDKQENAEQPSSASEAQVQPCEHIHPP